MEFCINADELRKALADIERAEKGGFMHCLAVFQFNSAGPMLSQCQAGYSDMIERAHPTNGNLDWGRFQGVTRRNTFADGKLIPIPSGER